MKQSLKKYLLILAPSILAIGSGAALTLAFAPYTLSFLGILAPALLLFLISNTTALRAGGYGYFFGVGLFSTGTYWIGISLHHYGHLPNWLTLCITTHFILLLALFPGIVAYLFNRYFLSPHPISFLCAFPALWVSAEWARSRLFTGFPWLLLGYSQTHSPLSGYAPIAGVYSVSLLTLCCSALLILMGQQYQNRKHALLYVYAFSFLTIFILGCLLTLLPWTRPIHPPLPVSLVQGNLPITQPFAMETVLSSVDRYRQLTQPLLQESPLPALIIWPESAIPIALQEIKTWINTWDQQVAAKHIALVLGIPIQAHNMDYYYNAMIALGESRSVYLKRHLVPFGEYLPLPNILSRFFIKWHWPVANLLPGASLQPSFIAHGVKILAGICYESAFPELFTTADPNIALLLILTNDAWFGRSAAKAQHLEMAAMRAMELRRPLLFASNDGVTAIINAMGQITHIAPTETEYVLQGTVQPMKGLTPIQRWGIHPLLWILIGTLWITRYIVKKHDPSLSKLT